MADTAHSGRFGSSESHLHPVTQRRIAIRELKHQRLTSRLAVGSEIRTVKRRKIDFGNPVPCIVSVQGLATELPEKCRLSAAETGNISAPQRMQAAPCNNACLLAITDNPPVMLPSHRSRLLSAKHRSFNRYGFQNRYRLFIHRNGGPQRKGLVVLPEFNPQSRHAGVYRRRIKITHGTA